MSRYVHVRLAAITLDEVCRALAALGHVHARGEIMLEGSLECAGEPVHVRVEPASVGAVEDFGFVIDQDALVLVCGELDRDRLQRDLVPRINAAIAQARLRAAAEATGVRVDVIAPERTLRLRRS